MAFGLVLSCIVVYDALMLPLCDFSTVCMSLCGSLVYKLGLRENWIVYTTNTDIELVATSPTGKILPLKKVQHTEASEILGI